MRTNNKNAFFSREQKFYYLQRIKLKYIQIINCKLTKYRFISIKTLYFRA